MIENCIFSFDGIRSDDMGLVVEKLPNRPIPRRKQLTYNIAGRNGDLIVDQNSFENVSIQYRVYLYDSTNIDEKIRSISSWLLKPKGYESLSDNTDAFSTYRKARFVGGDDFENRFSILGRGILTFDCCPQRYPIEPEVLRGTFGDTFTLPTHADMFEGYPFITLVNITGNWSGEIETDTMRIVIPSVSATVHAVYIDFETHLVTDWRGRKIPLVSTSGTWKPLGDGDSIQTTETSWGTVNVDVAIETRRWYL